MKELHSLNPKPIIEAHYPVPRKYQMTKRWVIAQDRKNFKQQNMMNSCLEADYHRIIDAVKHHHLTEGEVYFDKDSKHDKTENFCAMHSFMNSSFYIYLECSFDYYYRVEYAFYNCPFEADIRTMLVPYPLDRQALEVALQPNFETYYKTVLRAQKCEHIHIHKA